MQKSILGLHGICKALARDLFLPCDLALARIDDNRPSNASEMMTNAAAPNTMAMAGQQPTRRRDRLEWTKGLTTLFLILIGLTTLSAVTLWSDSQAYEAVKAASKRGGMSGMVAKHMMKFAPVVLFMIAAKASGCWDGFIMRT